jgi:hypothetical protein
MTGKPEITAEAIYRPSVFETVGRTPRKITLKFQSKKSTDVLAGNQFAILNGNHQENQRWLATRHVNGFKDQQTERPL